MHLKVILKGIFERNWETTYYTYKETLLLLLKCNFIMLLLFPSSLHILYGLLWVDFGFLKKCWILLCSLIYCLSFVLHLNICHWPLHMPPHSPPICWPSHSQCVQKDMLLPKALEAENHADQNLGIIQISGCLKREKPCFRSKEARGKPAVHSLKLVAAANYRPGGEKSNLALDTNNIMFTHSPSLSPTRFHLGK